MKKFFGFILIIAGMIISDIYIMDWQPKYFMLIILANLFVVFCLISVFLMGIVCRNRKFDSEKALRAVRKPKKLSKKQFEDLIVSILINCGYSGCEKAKKNPYGINYICDNTAFYIRKRKDPVGEVLAEELGECKDYFGVYSVCIITDAEYTKYAKETAGSYGVFLWDMKKMEKLLNDYHSINNKKKSKNHIHTEDLDGCRKNDFAKLLKELLSRKYEFAEEKNNNILIFRIDDTEYHIFPIKSDPKTKISMAEINTYYDILKNENTSNIMFVSNGYFHREVQEWAMKMKISLWNRDNIDFLIRSIK